MSIVKKTESHYVKVLSPEILGVAGRLYSEIETRKENDLSHDLILDNAQNRFDQINSQLDIIQIRYDELNAIMDKMFPDDEDVAIVTKPMIVTDYVKATNFVSTVVNTPPFTVASTQMVANLNVEFLGGIPASGFTPISHVGSSGVDQHAVATQTVAGFHSAADKLKLDNIVVSATAPANPPPGTIWFDIS